MITSCEKQNSDLYNNSINAIKSLVINKFVKNKIDLKRKIKIKISLDYCYFLIITQFYYLKS